MKKLAVVLFNLGGPDDQASVRPFLFNLFNDKAIISLPQPFRWLLAKLISSRRAPVAREIYRNLGGGSPLLSNTKAQAKALEAALSAGSTGDSDGSSAWRKQVFVAMRYWHPFAEEVVAKVKAYQPDHLVLLPLYPQYSTTTSGSSLRSWRMAAHRANLDVKTSAVCCYPQEAGFVEALAKGIEPLVQEACTHGEVRVLFSAHGLPKKIVAAGDPYQWQVEQTAAAVAARLGQTDLSAQSFDWVVCYQSRVGPLEWIGPSTEDEIRRAGGEKRPLVVVPLAFVSEHSETLVELDIEYRELAEESGVPAYLRMPTVDCDPAFIDGLAAAVEKAMTKQEGLCRFGGGEPCGSRWTACPLAGQ